MSASNAFDAKFAAVARSLTTSCNQALDRNELSEIPEESLCEAFAGIVRLYAAKAQISNIGAPFGRNGAVTVTDVAIACTAMLEGIGLTLFDLGAWQTLASVRPKQNDPALTSAPETANDVTSKVA